MLNERKNEKREFGVDYELRLPEEITKRQEIEKIWLLEIGKETIIDKR